VRDQRDRVAVRLAVAITVTVEQQFRKGALPARYRMQAGADTLPHPIAFPERLAVAAPVDRAKRDNAEPERQFEQFPDAHADNKGIAQRVTLELA